MMLNFFFLVLSVPKVIGMWFDSITVEPPITEPVEESTPGFWDSVTLEPLGEEPTELPSGGFFRWVTIDPPGLQVGEFPTDGPSPVSENPGESSRVENANETRHSATAPHGTRDSSTGFSSLERKLDALLVIGALLLLLTGGQLCMNLRTSQVCLPPCGAHEQAGSTNEFPEDCTGSPTSKEQAGSTGPEAVV
ncbi:hypothetical protein FOL47_005407 [Perkinsus chesapeaki]|uniref:Uncharacterized protein n=1 Tax=Perkinsus chesapeaki TaxID=330153 RepID=A0A7J6N2J3_PERCH|nr:hypothetical protein FOL47_005407 [Perkinsus chesapeaki]